MYVVCVCLRKCVCVCVCVNFCVNIMLPGSENSEQIACIESSILLSNDACTTILLAELHILFQCQTFDILFDLRLSRTWRDIV